VPLSKGEKQVIDVSNLPSGIYIVKVNFGENLNAQKIIVK